MQEYQDWQNPCQLGFRNFVTRLNSWLNLIWQPMVESTTETRVYDRTFCFVFLANFALMSAVSLLYFYEDFVNANGGTELQLGWIIGSGMIGAIAFRLSLGVAIDRVGIRVLWMLSLSLVIVGSLWHTRIDSVVTWQVYVARLILAAGMAGSLGCWLTFASLRAPKDRIAEVIGVVGISGFSGMAFGPTLGDWILSDQANDAGAIDRMFYVAACLAVVSMVFALIATQAKMRRQPTDHRPFAALRNTRLGFLVVIAITMGMAASIPSTFFRPFTKSIGIESVAIYFWTYNITAATCRIVFRKAGQVIGLRMMTVIGMATMALSMLLYLIVTTPVTLIIPAIAAGISHAFMFPAVMAAGTNRFADEYRGLAVSLMFALFDIGICIGAPLFGFVLWTAENNDLPPYPTMFTIFAVWIALVIAWYVSARFMFKKQNPASLGEDS